MPPLGVLNPDGSVKREPTDPERANFAEDFHPGALHCDTCPCHTDDCREKHKKCEKDHDCCDKVKVNAVIRKYEVAAVQRKIFYNHHGDHDPHGLIFVPLADAENPVPYFDYPRVPLDMPHKPSMRVSLNPQFLHYDPVCDSGINVGYNNREQTVAPGESKKYLWYADKEYGPALFSPSEICETTDTTDCLEQLSSSPPEQNGIAVSP